MHQAVERNTLNTVREQEHESHFSSNVHNCDVKGVKIQRGFKDKVVLLVNDVFCLDMQFETSSGPK